MADRSEVRRAFANILSAELVGDGKLLQVVYPYKVADLGGQSPVAVIASSGTERTPFTFRGSHPAYLIDVFVFVLYAAMDEAGKLATDVNGAPVWDEADAEDTLDEIEAALRLLIDRNQAGQDKWKAIDYAGPTQTDVLTYGGVQYTRELVPLRFETL